MEEVKEEGPLDLQRRKDFAEIESRIEKAVSTDRITFNIVNLTLKSAVLAAKLEKPKEIVQGLFERAIRFARKYGTSDQLFNAVYQNAWTSFFWYEDFERYIELYDQVEVLALNSTNIYTVERLNNLWSLLNTHSKISNLVSWDIPTCRSYGAIWHRPIRIFTPPTCGAVPWTAICREREH